MKSETSLHNDVLTEREGVTGPRRRSLRSLVLSPLVCSIAASVGIFGGISSLVAGVICVVMHAVIPSDVVLDHAGTTLLILGVPMLLIGSVFLDEIDVKK